MNRRTKQFYKQWIKSEDSFQKIGIVFDSNIRDFYRYGPSVYISSPSHAFEHNVRVYIEKNVIELNNKEFLDEEDYDPYE